MILGIGTDIEEIKRFESIKENAPLMDKCFTKREQEYFLPKKLYAQSAAGIFCAKEALFKAAGTGLLKFALTDAEIDHDEKGAPYFVFYAKAAEYMKNKRAFVSISHSGEYAAATAVLETEG